jgi:PmbA protein
LPAEGELELELAARVVALALEAGASEAEATYFVTDGFSAEARGEEIVKLEQSVGRSLTLRAFVYGAKASLGTSDFSPDGLRAMVGEAVDAARFVGADPRGGLPHEVVAPGPFAELELYANDVRARAAEMKLDDALELERAIRAAHPSIVNSSGSRVADATTTVALANSKGFAGSYRSSQASISASPVASDGPDKRTGSYGSAARSYARLEAVTAVAAKAARRATGMIGARRPPTMRCPVIFERDVAAAVLSDIFSAVNAANVAVGNSFLAGKIGERIGSDLVTILDDGRLRHGLGSAPFDAEGVPTRRKTVFERGVLRTFLYDTYYARRLEAESTGNASGGGIGPTNFYLEPGSATLEELIATTKRGVFVVDTIGFSTESVTGTYSRGARGFAIEDGALAYPIDEFTIAGNLATMLAAVDGVASDLIFDQSIIAPSLRIAEMTVSGN